MVDNIKENRNNNQVLNMIGSKVVVWAIALGLLLTLAGLTIFTPTDKPTLKVAPKLLISEAYDSCGMVGDKKGYLGWPVVVLGSNDEQSCGGNSAILYEEFYPVGLVLNVILASAVSYVISRKVITRRIK